MRIFRGIWIGLLFAGGLALADTPKKAPTTGQGPIAQAPYNQPQGQPPPAPTPTQRPMGQPMSRDQVLRDIQRTLGFVPAWMRQVPSEMLPGWWDLMKNFMMSPNTALDQRTKELIGLAVASQIPCEYCVQYHRESARMNGASEQEIDEAVGMASMTRMGSTLLNGMQVDKAQFKRDLDRMARAGRQQASRAQPRPQQPPATPPATPPAQQQKK